MTLSEHVHAAKGERAHLKAIKLGYEIADREVHLMRLKATLGTEGMTALQVAKLEDAIASQTLDLERVRAQREKALETFRKAGGPVS